MAETKTDWTRADVEALRGWERPKVRCSIGERACPGTIIPDVNPWVEVWDGGEHRAEQFSWPLVLEVLNNPFAAPIYYWPR